ncbi:reverse transcriptase domain-containing protein [Desulfobacterium sp. N47]
MFSKKSLTNAFDSVKANNGCAGVDGVTIQQFEHNLNGNLFSLSEELKEGKYYPLPLMKILVSKKNGEPRGLCIPAVRDRVVQRAVLDLVEPVLEKQFEDCSYAYRKGRSVRQVIYLIMALYREGYRFVVDADIDAFFDNVDHDLLKSKFNKVISDPLIQQLIAQWVGGEVWDGTDLKIITKGIPQGSVISPLLANLFLDELDEVMLAQGFKFIRYADDYVVLCKSRENAVQALDLSKEVLKDLKLELDEEAIITFEQGFKYLGVVFLRNMAMKPFEEQTRERKILFYPEPLDLETYKLKKRFDRNRT